MDNEERVVHLAKPVKKGILRLVFSRVFVIALLLILQIAILLVAYQYFTDKLPILINLMRLFAFVMVIYLFNCSMDSSAKLTWMWIIAIFPLAGAVFLLFTQSNIGHRMERKLVAQQIQESRQYLTQPEQVLEQAAQRVQAPEQVPGRVGLQVPERRHFQPLRQGILPLQVFS